ncbi:MAG: D-alanyl-D-alanine carboxypeptidase/D-alanyl-D-alanine-endopeptidase [Melioribacteraceae bacterium]|nr:D-alanyl-D-alanine carboxypeptidase/D-alanyl-D-alanine-endopeptidase [Melioribacteraceae bacterium]
MKNLITFLLIVFIISACSTFKQEKSYFEKRIDSLLVSDFFQKSNISISALDFQKDSILISINSKKLMRPASNQKILTTATALYFLGKDYQFQTSFFYDGEIKDSVLYGNIFVTGSFDPDFSTNDLDSVTTAIKNIGIKKINGNIYTDISKSDSLYFGQGWIWSDEPETYMPYLSQLAINKNSLTIYFEPDSLNKPAKISFNPKNNFVQLINNSKTTFDGNSNFEINRDWLNHNNKIISKGNISINSKKDSIEVSVREPHFYFLSLFKEKLINSGIQFSGTLDTCKINSDIKLITSFKRNIIPVITNTNKVSDNLSAEMLLRAVAGLKFNKQSAINGKFFIDSLITLSGANPKEYRIADGSGLSYYNLLSSELLIKVLKFIKKQNEPIPTLFINTLPIGGIDGTLANRFKNSSARGFVFAKTGTISGVSSLSGYIKTKKNNLIVFSILIQNFVGSSKQARDIQDKICEIIYNEL